jgi:hypothetical protein
MKLPLRVLSALSFSLVVGVVALAGCGDADSSCERIAEACHDLDTGSGKPHECHEAAEKAGVTEAECAALETDCLAACPAE